MTFLSLDSCIITLYQVFRVLINYRQGKGSRLHETLKSINSFYIYCETSVIPSSIEDVVVANTVTTDTDISCFPHLSILKELKVEGSNAMLLVWFIFMCNVRQIMILQQMYSLRVLYYLELRGWYMCMLLTTILDYYVYLWLDIIWFFVSSG